MNYFEIKPNKFLLPYINCYWTLNGKSDLYYDNTERVLPDGCIELIINFEKPFEQYCGNGKFEKQPSAFIVGQIKNYKLLKPSCNFDMIGIRFKPAGAFKFLNFPLDEISSQTVDAELIWGNDLKVLQEKMSDAKLSRRIFLLENFLLEKSLINKTNLKFIDASVNLINYGKPIFTVEKLAAKLEISKRQIERNFKQFVGIPPKTFLKIRRLQNVFKHIQNKKQIDWLTLSYISGYYDQSHFINDFREFSGMNPSEYLSSKESLVDYFINK
ncbi:MAG: AraC family transcriptional regulator [Melioribacteraceae bacterium]|nr:MAG: AraC family transcriptional regulator [Melioribacteraceae bacterium]